MQIRFFGLLASFLSANFFLLPLAAAGDALPWLPPAASAVAVLQNSPLVREKERLRAAETARREQLIAGDYEWRLTLGRDERRSYPEMGKTERFSEFNLALERPIRLFGKGDSDAALGRAVVELAELAHREARHIEGRRLLDSWFAWLKNSLIHEERQKQFEIASQLATTSRRRQALGEIAALETVLAEAEEAQARALLIKAKADEESARQQLQLGFPGLPLQISVRSDSVPPLQGSCAEWFEAILSSSHELAQARGESQLAQLQAGRAERDRLPDPTLGVALARERGGEERVAGAFISLPLPGKARAAAADAFLARASAANEREAAALQKVKIEAGELCQQAKIAPESWHNSADAAMRMQKSAAMLNRARELGEGSLIEVLSARRLASEATLGARIALIEAYADRYRLFLAAHRLW